VCRYTRVILRNLGSLEALFINGGTFIFQVLRGIESLMTAFVDPAFKAVPENSTAFLIWRIEVSDTDLTWIFRGKRGSMN
jgi:hypothetical protein